MADKKLVARLIKGATFGMKVEDTYKTYVKGQVYPIVSETEYKLMAMSDAFQITEAGSGGSGIPAWPKGEGEGAGEEGAGEGDEAGSEEEGKSKGKSKSKGRK